MPGVLSAPQRTYQWNRGALRARHGNCLSVLSQNVIERLSSCLVTPAGLPGDGFIREHL